MAMNGNGLGYYGRPGPRPGSTFAGGSFSPRRRMIPTSTSTSPTAPTAAPQGGMATAGFPGRGLHKGWKGQPLPPGLMKKQQAGRPLPGPWAARYAAATAAGAAPAAAGAPTAPTHRMPDGSSMAGAAHMPSFPTQAQVPMAGFMPPGLMRQSNGRRVMTKPSDGMEQFPYIR